MPKVFSVIVTYNGKNWLERCLRCLFESEVPTEVLVIDNNSTDNTLEIIEPYKHRIHLFKNTLNEGFGQANNRGIEYAFSEGADFIFLLNQDAYIFPDTVGLLIDALQNNKDFGILSPLQLAIDGKKIESIFKQFLLNNFTVKMVDDMFGSRDFDGSQPRPMRFVNAAAWMITRRCIEKTGLFHPVFFHYGEDNHYASRVQYHKLKIGVLPASRVIHDCKPEQKNSYDLLIRKMKNIPLYTLLDLRKPFFVAYLLGLQKWNRLAKKIRGCNVTDSGEIIKEQKRWFNDKIKEAIAIRKQTAKEWFKK